MKQADSAIAHLVDLMSFDSFAARFPTVYAAGDPQASLDEQYMAYVELSPSPWPLEEPEASIATRELARPGLVAGLLEGGLAIVGSPRAVYRHMRDEATVRFWLGKHVGEPSEAVDISCRLTRLQNRLAAVGA